MNFPWRRKTDNPSLPKEVQDYYQAEKRERLGVASLLAAGTLVVTVLLALGIFFGGRWVWRHAVHRQKPSTTATVNAPDDKSSSATTQNKPTATTNNVATGSGKSTPANNPTTQTSTGPASNPPAGASSTAPAGSATSPTGNRKPLPSTGPGNILPYIVGVVTLGIATAETYQRRRLRP